MACMYFGYKFSSVITDAVVVDNPVRNHACWASLRYCTEKQYVSEVTWSPNQGQSEHVKLLLPLMFSKDTYEEVETTRNRGAFKHYGIRFHNLKNEMRNHFMFRLFVIRNIDRDSSCTKMFDILLKLGVDPLQAAVVAANTMFSMGFGGAERFERKGYANCLGPEISIADIRAFARDPLKPRNLAADWVFGKGRGYGYFSSGNHNGSAAMNALFKYKNLNGKFTSPKWCECDSTNLGPWLAKLTNKKKFNKLSALNDLKKAANP